MGGMQLPCDRQDNKRIHTLISLAMESLSGLYNLYRKYCSQLHNGRKLQDTSLSGKNLTLS
jgi:hypothetical protein